MNNRPITIYLDSKVVQTLVFDHRPPLSLRQLLRLIKRALSPRSVGT